LAGFLEDHVYVFMKELWSLLLSAQKSLGGIPQEFIERKKLELLKKRVSGRAFSRFESSDVQ
jgi:serine/arginine repetitive matrix protein 1